MTNKTVRITNIQHFSLHDGPGIRTTVFFKGCSLHCPWCSNPENIEYRREMFFNEENCIKKNGTCLLDRTCPILNNNFNIFDSRHYIFESSPTCVSLGVYGYDIPLDELEREIYEDIPYYEQSGGVTFSGGEPLLQFKKYQELVLKLKRRGVNIGIETCLYVAPEIVNEAVQIFDFMFIDMKLMRSELCKEILGGDLNIYIKNLEIVCKSKINMCIRIPAIEGVTLRKENIGSIIFWLEKLNIKKNIQLLPGHNLGEKKYRTLGRRYNEIPIPNMSELENSLKISDIQYEVMKL